MAVTVTYEFPTNVVPSGSLSGTNDRVSGTILTDGSATSITVTHNLGISNADRSFGLPEVYIEPLTRLPTNLFVLYKDASAVNFTFSAEVTLFRFVIKRPHTIGR